jgi:GDP-L-fucose synthase
VRRQTLDRSTYVEGMVSLMDDSGYVTDAASGSVSAIDREAPVWIAGHRGLVGRSMWRLFQEEGFQRVIGQPSSILDLTNRASVHEYVAAERPKTVVLAAAYVGGIVANNTFPVDFISRNLQIQVNVMDAAATYGVERLLFFGSSCIYPKFALQPMREDYLHTGQLESTNEAFAVAKLAGIAQVRAVRRQYGLPWIAVMPTNLYGPGDNFSESGSHVLSALVRRFDAAVAEGAASVTNWGSG